MKITITGNVIVERLRFSFRLFVILFPGLVALYLILRALWGGNTSDIRYGLGMTLILGISLMITGRRTPCERPVVFSKSWLLWIGAIALIVPINVVALIFGRLDMSAFVFHWFFGVEGAPWWETVPYILTVLVYWISLAVTFLRLAPWALSIRRPHLWFALGVLAMNPLIVDVLNNRGMALIQPRESYIGQLHRAEIIERAGDLDNPNIIYVYLEGLERTYGETTAFGNVYAPIDRIAANSIEFSNIEQVVATGWSIAGMIATQCGVPLLVDSLQFVWDKTTDNLFVPGVICISDVTKSKGYQNVYLAGTEIVTDDSFFGFGKFFETHGVEKLIDLSILVDEFSQSQRVDYGPDGWGYRDELVFERALQEVDSLLADGRPFLLTIATIDTHGPQAFRSDVCLEPGDPIETSNILDAVECTAALAERFIINLKAKTAGTNTRIVVMSDHLAHKNSAYGVLEQLERRNTVLLIGDRPSHLLVSKPGSMMDVYPTVLEWIGWLPPKKPWAGIGVSLLSNTNTLLQESGLIEFNNRLKADLDLTRALWDKHQGNP